MYIVTGGAGFIGSNLVAALEARKLYPIVVCDNLGDDDKWNNLRKHEVSHIVTPPKLLSWMDAQIAGGKKIEAVFHIGGIASTTESDVDLILANNFDFSVELYKWCVKNKVRFIYASSAATYGDGGHGFKDDESIEFLRSLKPLNPYGWSKNLFDMQVVRMRSEGLAPPQSVGLKIFYTYGPNEYHKGSQRSVLSQMFAPAAKGLAVKLFKSENAKYKDGEQLRDFLYVRDLCDVFMWALDNPNVSGLFNVGSGKARTFKDLANALFKSLGQPQAKVDYIDMPLHIRHKYQYITEASLDKLRAAGYTKAFTTLEDGVADFVKQLASGDPYL